MASVNSPVPNEWETMCNLIDSIRLQKVGPSAPMPDRTPISVQLQCTQAYTRGKIAARDSSIQGPQVTESASDHQKLVLATYFSLGLEAGSESSMSSRKEQYLEGKKPDEFRGERSQYKSFASQLALAFRADPSKFRDDQAKINFAATYLRGPAFDWLQPYIRESDGEVLFQSYKLFLTSLEAGFADPDAYATAEKEIEESTQKYSCSAYYSQFVGLLAQLRWTEDPVKIHYFRRGLKEDIKDLLVGRDLPETITEFAALCIKLDNQITARARERNPPKAPGYPINNVTPITQTSNLPRFIPMSSTPATTQPTGDPMELDAASRKAYRKANNLCTYCGASGHWVKNCPKSISKNNRIASATANTERDFDSNKSSLYQTKNLED